MGGAEMHRSFFLHVFVYFLGETFRSSLKECVMFRKFLGLAIPALLLGIAACSGGKICGLPDPVLESSSSIAMETVSSSGTSGDCTEPKEVSEMWNGFATPLSNVETGLDNGTEISGYWFSFGNEESGNGKVIYPATVEYTSGSGFEPYAYCMGICGELEFAKEGYLGVGFHVAGLVDPLDDNSPAAKANISEWGGLCVTYASDVDLEIVLAYYQDGGFGNFSRMPKMTLPKSIELKTVCADWDDFMTVFSEVSSTFMTSILFAVQGETNTKSRFNIRGLGKYSEKTNFCSTGEDSFVSGQKGLVIK